jgi:hypothetical protein
LCLLKVWAFIHNLPENIEDHGAASISPVLRAGTDRLDKPEKKPIRGMSPVQDLRVKILQSVRIRVMGPALKISLRVILRVARLATVKADSCGIKGE